MNGTTSLCSVSVNSDRLRQHAEQMVAQTAKLKYRTEETVEVRLLAKCIKQE